MPATTLLTLAMLALLAACKPAEPPPQETARPVRTVTVERQAGGETVSLTGQIQAQEEVSLSFRTGGRMIERSVNVGDQVKPGQVIAKNSSRKPPRTRWNWRART